LSSLQSDRALPCLYVIAHFHFNIPLVGFFHPLLRKLVPQVEELASQIGNSVPRLGKLLPQSSFLLRLVGNWLPQVGGRAVWAKKNSIPVKEWSFEGMATTYSPTIIAVPSALAVLTSLFGMGRGGTPPQ
jgi:hypothetical protein